MDIEALMAAITIAGRQTRQGYHLTLGCLISALEAAPNGAAVQFDHGAGLGPENSYRGYYEDLAFSSGAIGSASDALKQCKIALGKIYEGYKGGDFTMSTDTVLWNAPYGCCGRAITGADLIDGTVILTTREIDS